MNDLDRLKAVAPPPAGKPKKNYDWETVEQTTGRLPEDYKEFLNGYGSGRFWGELGIAPPDWIARTRDQTPQGTVGFLRGYSTNREEYVRLAATPGASIDEIAGTSEDEYLQFGAAGTGQILFWRITDGTADSWPVVVTNTSGIDYASKGMVAYLIDLLGGTFTSAAFGEEWLDDVRELNPDQPFTRIEN